MTRQSHIDIVSNATFHFDPVDAISTCGYTSIHTPVSLVSGTQAVTGIYDVSHSNAYPDFYFIHLDIQGADDYLDCGGKIAKLQNAIMIAVPKRFYAPGENPRDLQTLKNKLVAHGINKAFRANQWRTISGTHLPTYSCTDDQLSADLSFFSGEPGYGTVHDKAGDLGVNTYMRYQERESLKDYLARMRQ
jgi:hypothetical protein